MKPLFQDMIAQHEGLADELKLVDQVAELQIEVHELREELLKVHRDLAESKLNAVTGWARYKMASQMANSFSHERMEIREAIRDMLSGWKYIRSAHGDLYGVGWDRAQEKAEKALGLIPENLNPNPAGSK